MAIAVGVLASGLLAFPLASAFDADTSGPAADDPTVPATRSDKIVGGVDDPGATGVVRLAVRQPGGGATWSCTGVVVGLRHVITARHCLGPDPLVDVTVVTDTRASAAGVEAVEVRSLSDGLDAAVLETAAPLATEPRPVIGPQVDLGLGARPVDGVVVGWGATDQDGGTYPDVVQRGEVTIAPDPACAAAWGSAYVVGTHLCTVGPAPCFGDSGGPLLVEVDGTLALAGVVSYGSSRCGDAPTVHVAAPPLVDALGQIVGDLVLAGSSPEAPSADELVARSAGGEVVGYWVLGGTGHTTGFGAPDLGSAAGRAVGIEATPDGQGVWVLDASGTITALGTAPPMRLGAGRSIGPGDGAAALAATPDGAGLWVVTERGRVLEIGTAADIGDLSARTLNAPIIDATATATGEGMLLAAADGGVFAMGDAAFAGSLGGSTLNAPVAGIAATPEGQGYWMVAADGGVFAFGDAGFHGSMAGAPLVAPVVGMVRYGDGYLLVAADGGVFVFSTSPFVGSLGDRGANDVIVDVAPRAIRTLSAQAG